MADIIKLLPDHVANQIAAGEVVQRPASVVKELLENAIDAGSTSIKLIVKEGGKTLIQVVDNGVGMSATDARLSFERHATSKIRKAEDLFKLDTKGFRGEALASIAAIAHVEMQTKTRGEDIGWHLKIEGSKIVFQETCATQKGTSISVKHLFFNIPARRNFLKSNQVELRHITDEFHRVALAHPKIAFQFYNNGSELFNLPSSGLRKRIVHIFGSRTNQKLVPLSEETQVVKISGFIMKPEFAKKSRREQFFFVNDRFIKSPYLHHSVLAAYEGLMRQGTHPGYFIYLEVDPGSIDINIHPTKTEVKFDDEHTLYAIIRSTVKHSLGQFNVTPALDFEKDQNLEVPYSFKDKIASQPRVEVEPGFNPFSSGGGTSVQVPKKKSAKGWENMYVGLESKVGQEADFSGMRYESDSITGSIFDDDKIVNNPTTTFQLHGKYIVTTIRSGMLVIDQQRAHQRVLYERFLKQGTSKEAVSQQLLFPLSIGFTKTETARLLEIKGELTALGFDFGTIDAETVQLKGIPISMLDTEVGTVLDQLLAEYQNQGVNDSFSQTDRLSKSLCKALSIKTGTKLDQESQMALVNDLFACKESLLSPFDKRIHITISETDIANKF